MTAQADLSKATDQEEVQSTIGYLYPVQEPKWTNACERIFHTQNEHKFYPLRFGKTVSQL